MSFRWLPNALTISRCLLAFVAGAAILYAGMVHNTIIRDSLPDTAHRISLFRQNGAVLLAPLIIYCLAAMTDFFDGFLARRLDAQTQFGVMLDPIADKLFVAITLLAVTYTQNWWILLVIPTVLIISRDLAMTGLRLAFPDKGGLAVVQLAKFKTALEMIAIAALLLQLGLFAFAGTSTVLNLQYWVSLVGLTGLYLAAALSLITAARYIQSMLK